MKLQNNYKILYQATRSAEKSLFASKTIPALADPKLTAFNDGTATVLDLKTFKLIYSDGTHLFGSLLNVPTEADVNIVLKDTDNTVVFGEIIDAPVDIEEDTDNNVEEELEESTDEEEDEN